MWPFNENFYLKLECFLSIKMSWNGLYFHKKKCQWAKSVKYKINWNDFNQKRMKSDNQEKNSVLKVMNIEFIVIFVRNLL